MSHTISKDVVQVDRKRTKRSSLPVTATIDFHPEQEGKAPDVEVKAIDGTTCIVTAPSLSEPSGTPAVSSIEPTSPNAAGMEERKGNEHDYRDEYNQIIDYIAAESKVDGFQFPEKACASLCKLLLPDYTFAYKPEWLTNALLASRNFTSTVTADQVALVKSIKAKL